MNGLILGAMMALSMVQQTDTTFEVGSAQVLNVETLGGSIEVTVWDEDRIRVQAEHSSRTFIEIDRGRREIRVESEARRGPANLVDFRITVPRSLGLDLEAQYGDVTIEGSDGTIKAETLQGDVTIIGGRGTIEVEATIGSIRVEGADGKIEIESSAADIHVVDSSGEIYAETAGGTIVLENVRPSVVDVGSTGGRVHYDGTFEPDGTYFFGAHGGSITIVVPQNASASINVATVHGSISSNLGGEVESLRGGERHRIEVGGGGALVEAETYGGRIRLLRRGSEGSDAPAPRRNRIREDGGEGWLAEAAAWATDWDHDVDVELEWDHDTDVDMDWDYDWDFGASDAEDRGDVLDRRDVSPVRLAARIAPGVSARVAPRVSANVAPRVSAEVMSRLSVAVAPVVSIHVSEALDAALARAPRPSASGPAATIRR